jgi:hypothetical protein
MMMSAARLAAMTMLSALLSGCVAALIPVAAGGVLVSKDTIGDASSPRRDYDGSAQADGANSVPMASEQIVVLEGADRLVFNRPGTRDLGAEVAMAPGFQPQVPGRQAFSEIAGYVGAQASLDPVAEPRQSALLATPGSLSPGRSDCSIRPPAVVFDLDPSGGLFDPAVEAGAEPALVQMLRAFRMQDIDVFWVSALPAPEAGAVRKRLVASGLDPAGRDGLLLMRRAEDRKQGRLIDLSGTHCVIAIAGDAKSDFDELYDYLKDPYAAYALDELLNAGWFITPLPLPANIITEGS